MEISKGIEGQGRRVEIPDCGRDDLPAFFAERGYKVGAEIGVYKGDYTKVLARSGAKVFGIDPWIVYEDYKLPDKKQVERQERQNTLFEMASKATAALPNVQLIRSTSMEALQYFPDESLDFVYIDANHALRYVIDDIWEWSKKVRPGGVISGHDYGVTVDAGDKYTYHVKYAVDAYTEARQIKNWYVLGRKETREGEIRDKWRSWMWIK